MNQHCRNKSYNLLFVGIAWLLFACTSFSQVFVEWDKTAGGTGWEELNTLIATSDGGYLIGGLTTTDGPFPGTEITQDSRDEVFWPQLTGDMWLVKVNSLGQVQWDGRYGGYYQDRMWSVHETSDGGFILGGDSFSGADTGTEHSQFNRGERDYWLVKIDANGQFEQDFAFGGPGNDVFRVVIPVDDGFMLFGYSDSDSNLTTFGEKTEDSRGREDFWIVKASPSLGYLDDWTIGGDDQDFLNDVKQLPDGNFIISGWSASSQGNGEKTEPHFGLNDFWIMKVGFEEGMDDVIHWQMTLGGEFEDVPNDLIITPDGGIIVCGFSNSPTSTEPLDGNKTAEHYGNQDAWIIKIRDEGTNGVVEWEKSFGGNAADYGYSAALSSLGNVMVACQSTSQSDTISMIGNKRSELIGQKDIWLLYLDQSGNKIWDQSLGGLNDDTSNKIINAHEYGFVIGGNSSSMIYDPYKTENSRGLNDMWVIRTGCFIEPPGLEDLPFSCEDDLIQIDATVDSCDFCNYYWSDGSTEPVREFVPNTTIHLDLIVEHPDGCEVEDSITINVVAGIETAISDFSPITCYQDNDAAFMIEEVVGGVGPYLFSLNEGLWEEFAHYINLGPGEYTLEVVDTNGCTYDTAFYIEQPQEVVVELGEDIYIEFGDSVQLQALTNLIDDTYTFEWAQPDLLSCDDCLEPWVQPFFTTTYSIELKDLNGCAVNDNVRVIMDKSRDIFFPNAFSPNNDNINDFFTVYADASVQKINRMQIFDRWGEMMFEQKEFSPNVDQHGWDGRLDGRFMKPAVFTYLVEVEYVDERKEIFYGEFTLLR